MTSPLDGLCGPTGPLDREPPDKSEYLGLLRSGETRLADAKRAENALESRFHLAYNAAHALCLAALRRAGYRSSKRYISRQQRYPADRASNAGEPLALLHPGVISERWARGADASIPRLVPGAVGPKDQLRCSL